MLGVGCLVFGVGCLVFGVWCSGGMVLWWHGIWVSIGISSINLKSEIK